MKCPKIDVTNHTMEKSMSNTIVSIDLPLELVSIQKWPIVVVKACTSNMHANMNMSH